MKIQVSNFDDEQKVGVVVLRVQSRKNFKESLLLKP